MTDVKERYVEALRSVKRRAEQARTTTDRSREEQRVFDAFRRNAREDYRTLKKPSRPARGRANAPFR